MKILTPYNILCNQNLEKFVNIFDNMAWPLIKKKTNFMIFSNSPAIRNKKINIFIDNNNPNQNDASLLLPIEQISSSSNNPTIKFLGVLIDPDLSFKNHILHVEKQLSKGLYFLRTAKKHFSKHCLLAIYYTLLHCHITYALPIWSCTTESLLKNIYTKQKMAVRIITGAKFNAHTEPLFKEINLLPLPKLIYYFKLNFIHNFWYKQLPVAFDDYWLTNRQYRGNDDLLPDLRNDSDLYIPFCRLKSTERFPFFNLPTLWNSFNTGTPQISIIRDQAKFKFKLKEHLLSQLNGNYRCSRLFCPSCSNNY